MKQHPQFADLRLGVVPYLNALPLIEGLDTAIPRERWVVATPRDLAGLLAAGELDIALLPIAEVLRSGRYSMIPGCAIACEGSVRSVQLFSKLPLDEIRSVLLDRSSLTSVLLAQVVMGDLLEINPEISTSDAPFLPEFDWAAAPQDAFVVIGDTALAWENLFPHQLDLGEGWKSLTNLPFVFAVWAVRPGIEITPALIQVFQSSRDLGVGRASEIAGSAPRPHGLAVELVRDYLANSIRYDLGPRAMIAIDQFHRRLVRRGLLDAASGLPRIHAGSSGHTP